MATVSDNASGPGIIGNTGRGIVAAIKVPCVLSWFSGRIRYGLAIYGLSYGAAVIISANQGPARRSSEVDTGTTPNLYLSDKIVTCCHPRWLSERQAAAAARTGAGP